MGKPKQGAVASAAPPQRSPLKDKISIGALMLLIVFVPYQLYLDFSTGVPGLNGANILFLLALFFMEKRDKNLPPLKTPLKGPFMFYFFAVTLAFVVALSNGNRPFMDDVNYWKSLLFYPLLYFLFFHAAKDRATTRLLFAAVLFVVGVAALQAVRQGLDYGLGNFNETRRAAGPFSADWRNANRAGVFYAMFTPVMCAVMVLYKEKLWIRAGAAVGMGLCLFATFVTYSRQSYGIVAAVLMLFLLRRNVLVGVLALFLVMSYEAWLPTAAVQRIQMTHQESESGGPQSDAELDESTESRFIIWAGAAAMIAEHPQGVGLQRFRENLGKYSSIQNMDAHNYYVLTTAEAGILGGIALVTLLISLFFLSWPLFKYKNDMEAQTIAWAHRLCTIALIAGNLFGSAFNFGELMASYWVLSGLTARYRYLAAETPPGVPATPAKSGKPAQDLRRLTA